MIATSAPAVDDAHPWLDTYLRNHWSGFWQL